jgi:SAM-dependent methyltransferase
VAEPRHRRAVGGRWEEIGALQLEFMKKRGLRPEHDLLDIGCGSLRGGVQFVDYLDPGRYCGVDQSESLLDAGRQELEAHGLTGKQPTPRLDSSFELGAFGRSFEFALAHSLFTHLPLNEIVVCLLETGQVLNPGGTLYATFFENPRGTRRLGTLEHESPDGTIRTSVGSDPYHHGVDAFAWACEPMRLELEYIGDWGHPRSQRMLAFTRTA